MLYRCRRFDVAVALFDSRVAAACADRSNLSCHLAFRSPGQCPKRAATVARCRFLCKFSAGGRRHMFGGARNTRKESKRGVGLVLEHDVFAAQWVRLREWRKLPKLRNASKLCSAANYYGFVL